MTRGAASPSHDPGTPVSGVSATRPTFAERPSSGGVTSGPTFSKILVIALVSLFVLASAAFIISASSARNEPTPAPSAGTGGVDAIAPAPAHPPAERLVALIQASPGPVASPATSPSVDPLASLAPSASVEPLASPAALVDPAAIVELRMPFVPAINFWGTQTSITRADLVAALEGRSDTWDRVLIPEGDRAAIEAALGVTIAASVDEATPADIERALKVRKQRNLGLLRASDVTHRIRTLGVGDRLLFGNDRVGNLDNWPVVATVQGPAGSAWGQKQVWTMVAGGDSFTDRGLYERVVNRRKGIDYPFDGGTARVTGHYCCGPFVTPGHPVPSYDLAGPKGIVRAMVKDADLAIVNHESPIPDDWDFHLHGYFFSGKPALTEIFTRAGVDWMSLANNHIKDYGTDGIADTRRNLDRFGLEYSGAGKNLKQAREYSILEVKGVRIAIIPCTAIAPSIFATATSGGAMPCKNRYILRDIREAKTRADYVIVFPHWGVEYARSPQIYQRNWANKWVAAGADLVLGAHSHVAGAIEEIDGKPIFYSLGNFVFDQNWATYTMESFLIEASFHGSELVQLRLHPFLSHDQAQPNFLDPAKDDGKALMKAVRRSSFIDW